MKRCKHCNELVGKTRGAACQVCKDGIFRYKLNRLQQIQLYESQNRKCRLCDIELNMFVGHRGGFVDHCHSTGKIRGILCNRCNTIVGGLESHQNLERILNYIGA